MKAEELMIGDWISVMEIPAQVFELSYDNEEKEMTIGILDPQGEVYSCYYGYDHVEPIPLTAEILEKNGFSHIKYSDVYYSIMIGDTYVELRKYENMAVWFNWEENNDGVYADYILPMPQFVHQLQHALRLCNIEKEIEL